MVWERGLPAWEKLRCRVCPLPGTCSDGGSVGRLHLCRGMAPKLFWLWCAGLGFGTLAGMFGVFLMCIQICLF